MRRTGSIRGRESRLSVCALVTVALGVLGCNPELLVGDEKGLPDGRAALLNVPPWTPLAPYQASGECALTDETVRAGYEGWRRERNEVGVLVGTNWHGNLPSGKAVRLFIQPDTTASVIFGETAEALPRVQADKGYLCGVGPEDLGTGSEVDCEVNFDGASFEIHGATFEEDALIFRVYGNAPWQEWCALQSPVEWEAGTCEFFPSDDSAFGVDPDDRSICYTYDNDSFENGAVVDCSWLKMIRYQPDFCSCASDGCFAATQSPRDRLFRLTLSEDGEELSGSVDNQFGDGQALRLERVP